MLANIPLGGKADNGPDMSTGTDISVLYREFTDSLTEVLAETAGTPVRRGRLTCRGPSGRQKAHEL